MSRALLALLIKKPLSRNFAVYMRLSTFCLHNGKCTYYISTTTSFKTPLPFEDLNYLYKDQYLVSPF